MFMNVKYRIELRYILLHKSIWTHTVENFYVHIVRIT